MSKRNLAVIALLATTLLLAAPGKADDEGVLIVKLSIVATVAKCSQAGMEFEASEWTALSNSVWQSAAAQQRPRAERVRLWMIARSMFAKIDPTNCGNLRRQVSSWFPGLLGKER